VAVHLGNLPVYCNETQCSGNQRHEINNSL